MTYSKAISRRTRTDRLLGGLMLLAALSGCEDVLGNADPYCVTSEDQQWRNIDPSVPLCTPTPISVCGSSGDERLQVESLNADVLTLGMFTSACQGHRYRLCTDGRLRRDAASGEVTLEAWVVDQALSLSSCDMPELTRRPFDLSPIRDWYRSQLGEASGNVTIRLQGVTVGEASLSYVF